MPETHPQKIPLLNSEKEKQALAAFLSEQAQPVPALPQTELDLLEGAALGYTDQSRRCRYLLYLLAGMDKPTGVRGEGLLELRSLDGKLADAFLAVLHWWLGPTQSDLPLYGLLQRVEEQFCSAYEK